MFFSVFLARLFKSAVIKYGGPQFVTAGIWYGIDFLVARSHNPVMGF